MFDTINGLPVHALVVHAVVVLLPLSILGTVAIAVRPAWRRTYGLLVLAGTFVATALIPVATKSGRALEQRLQLPQIHHRQLGEQLKYFAIPLLLLVIALVVLDRRTAAAADANGSGPSGSASLFSAVNVVAALAVIAGIATAVQVYRVGDSGAHAVWSPIVQATNRR